MITQDENGFVLELPSVDDGPVTQSSRDALFQKLAQAGQELTEMARACSAPRDALIAIIETLSEADAQLHLDPAEPVDPWELLELTKSILRERQREYGSSEPHFVRVARIWSALLRIELSPHHVPLCLAALKLVRAAEAPDHLDSWIDLAGYTALGAQVAGARSPT